MAVDLIRWKGDVSGLFCPGEGSDHGGTGRVTERDVMQPAGNMTSILSLEVFYASSIKKNRRENSNLFQTLVRGAVMMMRPTTSSIGDRKRLRIDLFQLQWKHNSLAGTPGVGHKTERGGLEGATTFTTGSCGLRRHAAWRGSITRLSMNQIN